MTREESEREVRVRLDAIGKLVAHALAAELSLDVAHQQIGELVRACEGYLNYREVA